MKAKRLSVSEAARQSSVGLGTGCFPQHSLLHRLPNTTSWVGWVRNQRVSAHPGHRDEPAPVVPALVLVWIRPDPKQPRTFEPIVSALVVESEMQHAQTSLLNSPCQAVAGPDEM